MNGESPVVRFEATLDDLRDIAAAAPLARTVRECISSVRLVPLLVESGVLDDRDLVAMVGRGIRDWSIPDRLPKDDARGLVPEVFERDDWRWINEIPLHGLARLFQLFFESDGGEERLHADVPLALRTLALRLAAAGMHEEVEQKLAFDEHDELLFVDLPRDLDAFLAADASERDDALAVVRERCKACRTLVRRLRDDKRTYGTSLRLTRLTRRIEQQVGRMELLLCLVHPRDAGQRSTVVATLFRQLIEAEQSGHRVRRRLGQAVDELAYQITEHTATKGEKYTGGTWRTYATILGAAMGGGAIVGVFAVLKLYASKLSLSLAAQAFVYGLNYAVCFVLIYLVGATLATKQPAITASAIAKQIDERESRQEGLEQVAESVVAVWRNQFAAFLGNLVCAFPVALLFGLVVEPLIGLKMVDAKKAQALMDANHPYEGPTLFYAAVAGVFLFLAGLVQGVVDNRVVYVRLEDRLTHHPRLKWLGRLRAGLASYVVKHAGGLASNVVLGFLLGSAGVVGVILGLPLDIRHIAFSSAHVGIAVLDAPELLNPQQILILVVGVLGIGLMNFVVSFGLTLLVTLKSRQVTVTQGGLLAGLLLRRFVRKPLEWFVPARSERTD